MVLNPAKYRVGDTVFVDDGTLRECVVIKHNPSCGGVSGIHAYLVRTLDAVSREGLNPTVMVSEDMFHLEQVLLTYAEVVTLKLKGGNDLPAAKKPFSEMLKNIKSSACSCLIARPKHY